MKNISLSNILDVTLRDGGYLNQWQFSTEEIMAMIDFICKQGIHQVEIGFLRTPARTTSSVNGCPIKFLEHITYAYPKMHWVGMLNPLEDGWKEAVAGKLQYLSLIRLTCTEDAMKEALIIADYLHEQSATIKVSLNLICISSYRHDEIAYLLQKIVSSRSIDRVYLADSRGALYPHEVESLITLAKKEVDQPLGFHAHDTLGNAIENSSRAFSSGCDLIDVSLHGFGLSGGNTPLENYLITNNLADLHLKQDTLAFCERWSLKQDDEKQRRLYYLLAQKNIDPVWSEQLVEKYPDDLDKIVNKISREYYKTLSQVLDRLHQAHSQRT